MTPEPRGSRTLSARVIHRPCHAPSADGDGQEGQDADADTSISYARSGGRKKGEDREQRGGASSGHRDLSLIDNGANRKDSPARAFRNAP
jgi:hypothetical protein